MIVKALVRVVSKAPSLAQLAELWDRAVHAASVFVLNVRASIDGNLFEEEAVSSACAYSHR